MTPVLALFFGVSPLAAVSSDVAAVSSAVVASLVMKPIGGFMHLRHGTVHLLVAAGAEAAPGTGKSKVLGAGAHGLPVRRLATTLVGACDGLMVGMTSVRAGSLMIVSLLLLYPSIKAGQLVGIDLVTGSVLVAAILGVWLGAQVSSHAPAGLVRRALAIVFLGSSAKLLDASTVLVLLLVGAALIGGVAI
jgi:uncharacterized protein